MADKQLPPQIVRPAPHGSKRGWVLVTGEVPPETKDRLKALADRRPAYVSDLIREAIDALLEREAA